MELRFTLPTLRKLDQLGTEVILAGVASDEQPPHGLAGLLDWRMAGRISALIERGFVTGKVAEVVLLPGKPKLPFDKVLLFGVGSRADFSEPVYRLVVEKMLSTLEGLRARRCAVRRAVGRARDRELAGARHHALFVADTDDRERAHVYGCGACRRRRGTHRNRPHRTRAARRATARVARHSTRLAKRRQFPAGRVRRRRPSAACVERGRPNRA